MIFSHFWVYGMYGALGSNLSSNISIVSIFLLVTSVLVVLLALVFFENNLFSFTKEISYNDLKVTVGWGGVLVLLSWPYLTSSVTGDGMAHLQEAHLHGRHLVQAMSLWNFVQEMSFLRILQLFGLLGSVAVLALPFIWKWMCRRRIGSVAFLGGILLTFIGVRFVVTVLFPGGGGMHPSLRLFPIWLSSNLFYFTDFSFRLPGLVGLLAGLLYFYKWMKHLNVEPWTAWLTTLLVGTLPLFLHVATIVEPSIWTSILLVPIIGFILKIGTRQSELRFPAELWACLISAGILMRQPVVLLLLPWFYLSARDLWMHECRWRQRLNKFGMATLPFLVSIPFFIRSLIQGTPTTMFTTQASLLDFLVDTLSTRLTTSDTVLTIWRDLGWVGACGLVFVLIPCNRKEIGSRLGLIAFFSAGLLMFLSLPYVGHPRYQAEYALPFAAFGIVALITKASPLIPVHWMRLGLGVLVALNAYQYLNLWQGKIDRLGRDFAQPIVSEKIYDYSTAWKFIREGAFEEQTFVLGATYGGFPKLLSGVSVRSVLEAYERHRRFLGSSDPIGELDADLGVQFLLVEENVGNTSNGWAIPIEEIELKGWKKIKVFEDRLSGEKLSLFKAPPDRSRSGTSG